jgi:hypothetical protein
MSFPYCPISPATIDASTSVRSWDLGQSAREQGAVYQASDWVHLFQPPTEYSFDEALLLCRQDEDAWVAWIPSYGEIILKEAEFVPLASS